MPDPRITAAVRVAFLGALGVASYLAAATWVRGLAPWPRSLGMDVRVEAFLIDKDRYDAVFLGSSALFRAVVPEVIDDRLSTPASPFRSYNLAVEGMVGHETDALLAAVLAHRPARLSTVVIEATYYSEEWGLASLDTDRSRWCRGVGTTAALLTAVWTADRPLADRLRLMAGHLRGFAHWQSNVGRARDIIACLAQRSDPQRLMELDAVRRSHGHQPMTDEFYRRRRPWAKPPNPAVWRDYADRVAGLGREDHAEARAAADAFDVHALRAVRRMTSGLDVIYLLPPHLREGEIYRELHRRGELSELIDLHGTRALELYERDCRNDPDHLSDLGARRFSRRLAEELDARLQR